MVRYGNPTPTFEVVGSYDYTDGPEIVSTFEKYGFQFTPAQKHKLDLYGARNCDGSFAATSINDSTPRRNGKSFPTRLYAAWAAAIDGNKVLYSAHNGGTVTDMFRELCKLFEDADNYPDWNDLLDYTYKQPGREGIYLTTGACIEFNTRTNSGARGSGYKVVIIDEAQEFTDAQADSLLPTIAAAASSSSLVVEDPQIIYIGTPDYPECHGTVFRRAHDQAHAGTLEESWWIEYAIDEMPPVGICREELLELIYRTNPGLGYRVSIKALLALRAQMSWDGFCREVLGWWYPLETTEDHAIPANLWQQTAISAIGELYEQKMAFGVKFTPDGSGYALAGCKQDKTGKCAFELIEVGSTACGTKPLAAALKQRCSKASCVVVDGQAGAPALCDNLRELGVPKNYVVRPKTQDVILAASMVLDGLRDGSLAHTSTGQSALDESALHATKRKIGTQGGWGFGGQSAPIEACSLALFGIKTTKRNPKRKQVIL